MIHENFFICIGAQKAGSTWLHRQLYDHPEIWVPPLKELRFFDHADELDVTRKWITERYARNLKRARAAKKKWFGRTAEEKFTIEFVDWLEGAVQRIEGKEGFELYRALFADKNPADYRAFGEITPTYSAMTEAGMANMARCLPRAKLLFILRDPVPRCWSIAKKLAIDNRAQPELLEDPEYLGRYVTDPHHERCSRYDWTLRHLERFYPREQVMLVFYEEIFASRQSTLAFLERLCGFIGLTYKERYFPKAGEVILSSKKVALSDLAIETFETHYRAVLEPVRERAGHIPTRWGEWREQPPERALSQSR